MKIPLCAYVFMYEISWNRFCVMRERLDLVMSTYVQSK